MSRAAEEISICCRVNLNYPSAKPNSLTEMRVFLTASEGSTRIVDHD